MKGMLDPVYEEKVIGHAEVRQIFKASAIGNIAAVAAHLRTAAVRIVHFHLKIRFFRRIDKDHTVAADSEMSVT